MGQVYLRNVINDISDFLKYTVCISFKLLSESKCKAQFNTHGRKEKKSASTPTTIYQSSNVPADKADHVKEGRKRKRRDKVDVSDCEVEPSNTATHRKSKSSRKHHSSKSTHGNKSKTKAFVLIVTLQFETSYFKLCY